MKIIVQNAGGIVWEGKHTEVTHFLEFVPNTVTLNKDIDLTKFEVCRIAFTPRGNLMVFVKARP